MATTVSVSKGTVACDWSSNNATLATYQTLYTQSSGIAARIIVNSLEASNSIVDVCYLSFAITNGTTGIRSVIGLLRPELSSANVAISPQQVSLQTQGYLGAAIFSSTGFYNGDGLVRTSTIGGQPSAISGIKGSPSAVSYIPGNFWLANGDSVVVRGYWGGTGNVYYNFTIITES